MTRGANYFIVPRAIRGCKSADLLFFMLILNFILSLLDSSKADRYNEIRTAYANILYRWDLLEQRAMVRKKIMLFSYMQIHLLIVNFKMHFLYTETYFKNRSLQPKNNANTFS